jgi:DNA polymerase III sliding clamp (beta) subunit (PCNA family)
MQKTIELPAAALKNALAGLSKIVGGRRTLPVLGCIRVEAGRNGATLQATDLDSFVTWRIETTGRFAPCLVPFEPLHRIVKAARSPLRLVQDEHRVTVQSSFGTATVAQALATHPLEEWPEAPSIPEPAFTGDASFRKALREALDCASTDSSRRVINGACLDVTQAGCHTVVGTDGRHLYAANTFQFGLPHPVIVPAQKFLGWPGFYQDGDWRVAVALDKERQPEWVQLESDHWCLATRVIAGNYPNWRQVVPDEGGKVSRVTLDDEAVALMLDALPRLPEVEDPHQPVTLVVRDQQLELSAGGGTDPNVVPVPGATVSGPDVCLKLDRRFVIKALRFGFNAFQISDPYSPILFLGAGRHLVAMPLCDSQPAAPANPTPTPQPDAEAAVSASPSAPQPEATSTVERKTMTDKSLTPPQRGNLQPQAEANNNHNASNGSALSAAITQVETVRSGLRDVLANVNTTLDLLRTAEREKKASAREVESVRTTLRSLQKVSL